MAAPTDTGLADDEESQTHGPLFGHPTSALASLRGDVVELAPPATVAASELERGLEEVVAAVRSMVA